MKTSLKLNYKHHEMNPKQLIQEVENLNNGDMSDDEIQRRLEAIVSRFNRPGSGTGAAMIKIPISDNMEDDISKFIESLPIKQSTATPPAASVPLEDSDTTVSGAITRSDFVKTHNIEFSKTVNARIVKFYENILKPAFDRYGIGIKAPKYHYGHYCIAADSWKMNISISVNDDVVIFGSDTVLLLNEDRPLDIRNMYCLVPNFTEYLDRQSLPSIIQSVDAIAQDVSGILENLT